MLVSFYLNVNVLYPEQFVIKLIDFMILLW